MTGRLTIEPGDDVLFQGGELFYNIFALQMSSLNCSHRKSFRYFEHYPALFNFNVRFLIV